MTGEVGLAEPYAGETAGVEPLSPAMVNVRGADQLERPGRAATLREVGALEQAGAGVDQRCVRRRHVGARHDPRQAGVAVPDVRPPALDLDHTSDDEELM
jgi:hypothetical protein